MHSTVLLHPAMLEIRWTCFAIMPDPIISPRISNEKGCSLWRLLQSHLTEGLMFSSLLGRKVFKNRVGNRKDDYDTIMQKEKHRRLLIEQSRRSQNKQTNKKYEAFFLCYTQLLNCCSSWTATATSLYWCIFSDFKRSSVPFWTFQRVKYIMLCTAKIQWFKNIAAKAKIFGLQHQLYDSTL